MIRRYHRKLNRQRIQLAELLVATRNFQAACSTCLAALGRSEADTSDLLPLHPGLDPFAGFAVKVAALRLMPQASHTTGVH